MRYFSAFEGGPLNGKLEEQEHGVWVLVALPPVDIGPQFGIGEGVDFQLMAEMRMYEYQLDHRIRRPEENFTINVYR